MATFDADTTPQTPAAPAAPAKTDPAPAPAKPAAASGTPTTPAAATPAAAPDIWAKAPKHLANEFFKTKREGTEAITRLESKIKELENKPAPTAADDGRIKQYEQQLREANERLAAIDYRQSADFKNNYVLRWSDTHSAALKEVKEMQVITGKDDDGNITTRPATESDFETLRSLPISQQAKALEQFGHYAPLVVSRLHQLKEIQQLADRAIAEHAGKAEQTARERQANSERETQSYQQQVEASTKELQTQWPQHFAPDEKDPEISTALQKGYDFVDNILKQSNSLPPGERAAFNAVLRARAAAFQPKTLLVNRLTAENAALKAELSKFRKSDPGAQVEPSGAAAAPTGDDEIPSGIAAAAAAAAKFTSL